MNRVTRLELLWRVDAQADTWCRVESLLGSEAKLVERALSLAHASRCRLTAGYFIDIDGETWSDKHTVDELWMTTCWFHALAELFDVGHFGPTCGPWEESCLTWSREGDVLTMEDLHPSGSISMRRVVVPFRALAQDIYDAGLSLHRLIQNIDVELNRRAEGSGQNPVELERLGTMREALPAEADFRALDELGSRLRSTSR